MRVLVVVKQRVLAVLRGREQHRDVIGQAPQQDQESPDRVLPETVRPVDTERRSALAPTLPPQWATVVAPGGVTHEPPVSSTSVGSVEDESGMMIRPLPLRRHVVAATGASTTMIPDAHSTTVAVPVVCRTVRRVLVFMIGIILSVEIFWRL